MTSDNDNNVLWELEPHTKGKHIALRKYLDAWLPILGTWNGRILFIDGFAGPGEYAGGEEGSPIIAIKALTEHAHKSIIKAETNFFFVEKEPQRAEHLRDLLEDLKKELPTTSNVEVVTGKFDETMTSVLDALDAQNSQLAPAFVMVDPFGISDTPMSLISRILQNPRSEIYVSFMYESINRFKGTDNFEPHLNSLFGTDEWEMGLEIEDPEERKSFFYDLYERQLRAAGARYVLHFELYRGSRLIYAIFFTTQNLKGCDKMKEAIWKIAPDGDYSFRGKPKGQLTLDLAAPDFRPLTELLVEKFKGKGWIKIETIEDFIRSDSSPYYLSQLRRNALIPLEKKGLIEIKSPRKKKNSYPKGTRIKFL